MKVFSSYFIIIANLFYQRKEKVSRNIRKYKELNILNVHDTIKIVYTIRKIQKILEI